MSSTVTANSTVPSSAGKRAQSGVSFAGVLRSEWIKLWSLLSTRLLILISFVAMVGVGVLSALVRYTFLNNQAEQARAQGMELTQEQLSQTMPAGSGLELYNLPNAGMQIGVLVLGTLAVMFIASEYSTGMIRSSVTAVPKRLPVFAAKAIILVVISYILAAIAGVVTFALSKPMFAALPVDMDWSTDGVMYSVFTGGLYVAGVALIGLSLGTLLRNSAGGVTVLIAIFFVVSIAAGFLSLVPGEFWKYVPQYLPAESGGRFLALGHADGVVDPGLAGLIFLGWVLVFVIPAVVLLKKRDV
ncbi:ABC transporter permease [Pseudarthrobacter sp. J1738]|uniref:ABC transporter permease n=1 Tax=unclassified Pseudarthrobacter TaxID=2647000 RepID=UPI003D270903